MSSLRRWQTLALKHWSEWWQRPKLLAFLKQLQVELQRCWKNACKNACSRWTVQEALEAKMIEQAQQGELIRCRWASTRWHNSSRLQRVTLQPRTTEDESRQGNTSQSMQRGKKSQASWQEPSWLLALLITFIMSSGISKRHDFHVTCTHLFQ